MTIHNCSSKITLFFDHMYTIFTHCHSLISLTGSQLCSGGHLGLDQWLVTRKLLVTCVAMCSHKQFLNDKSAKVLRKWAWPELCLITLIYYQRSINEKNLPVPRYLLFMLILQEVARSLERNRAKNHLKTSPNTAQQTCSVTYIRMAPFGG